MEAFLLLNAIWICLFKPWARSARKDLPVIALSPNVWNDDDDDVRNVFVSALPTASDGSEAIVLFGSLSREATTLRRLLTAASSRRILKTWLKERRARNSSAQNIKNIGGGRRGGRRSHESQPQKGISSLQRWRRFSDSGKKKNPSVSPEASLD